MRRRTSAFFGGIALVASLVLLPSTAAAQRGGSDIPRTPRSWLGDSVGHWEGDTLVVDTTNFTDSPGLGGASGELHVIERFTRTDRDVLLYRFTVDDPTVWTEPWSGEYVWPATDERVYEYACHEANYSLGGILRGARLLENDVLAESR